MMIKSRPTQSKRKRLRHHMIDEKLVPVQDTQLKIVMAKDREWRNSTT